jgi:AcrR family transcriptional regulator
MTTTEPVPPVAPHRAKRADARRNYDKVVTAARGERLAGGAETSLEEIARRAGVGIGTLYRNFPNRQALLEAVYVKEVERLCCGVSDLADLSPWDALATWLRRFVGYMATKQALAGALLEYVDRDAQLFQACRASMNDAGGPLLARAQATGEVRRDTDLAEVIQLVVGVAKLPAAAPGQIEHLLEIVLDGLRAPVALASASD